jgi:hypothetical protein
VIRGLSRADWLNRDRVIAWTGVLLTLEAILLVVTLLWSYGFFPSLGASNPTDFVSFYAAGKLTLAGTPALSYVRSAHAAAETAAIGLGHPYVYFFYPPTFLLWCAPLALLPLRAACLVFEASSLGAWLLVANRILREPGWTWIVPVLAYPAVIWTLFLGQNAFVTAALLGATTLLLDKRPIVAGITLGLICYKPQLALIAPIALAAGGYWKTFGAATLTVTLCVILSAMLFGTGIWPEFFAALKGSGSVYNGDVTLGTYITSYGAVRVLGGNPALGWLVQTAVSFIAAGAVAWIWHRKPRTAVQSAALASGMLLSAPVALMYDMTVLMVAMAWLVRDGRKTGFLAWEKLTLAFCFLVPSVSLVMAQAIRVPIGPLAPAAILILCLVRTVRGNFSTISEEMRRLTVPA